MYYCTDCKIHIENPKAVKRKTASGEKIKLLCPVCLNELIVSAPEYCRYCGVKLNSQNEDGYCSDECKRAGKRLWTRELRRRQKIKDDPIARILRMLTSYNRENNTKYSYGQFVALVLPKLNRARKKAYGY